jgi:hypothetical protein
MKIMNTIHSVYTNIKAYFYKMYNSYYKPVTMPIGYTDWDYLVQLHIR